MNKNRTLFQVDLEDLNIGTKVRHLDDGEHGEIFDLDIKAEEICIEWEGGAISRVLHRNGWSIEILG